MKIKNIVSSKKILVIGDVILDHYIHGRVFRVSPEAPVPVVLKSNSVYCLGGAANVAQNVTSFGSECYLLGITGLDQSGEIVKDLCKQKGVITMLVEDPDRVTTEKTRIIGNNHQITRIDSESTEPISDPIRNLLLEEFERVISIVDGVIIQDYGKGLLTEIILQEIISRCRKYEKVVLVDPKEKDFNRYSGADWIKPNLSELKNAAEIQAHKFLSLEEIIKVGDQIRKNFNFGNILVTMSENGMLAKSENFSETVDGYKIDVTDVSGAGDTVSAVFMLMHLSGVCIKDTLKISNLAGSMVCKISGAVPINPNDLFLEALNLGMGLEDSFFENLLV